MITFNKAGRDTQGYVLILKGEWSGLKAGNERSAVVCCPDWVQESAGE